jgi:hypothetical protein
MRVVSVTPDHDSGPGYALMEMSEGVETDRIELAFSNVDHGFLWPSKSSWKAWRNEPHYLTVMRVDGDRPVFRLGPEICDFLLPDSLSTSEPATMKLQKDLFGRVSRCGILRTMQFV